MESVFARPTHRLADPRSVTAWLGSSPANPHVPTLEKTVVELMVVSFKVLRLVVLIRSSPFPPSRTASG